MDFAGLVYQQLVQFFGIEALLHIVASGNYRTLLTPDGLGALLGPLIPPLLLFELVRSIATKTFKRDDYQMPLLIMVLNRFIGNFISIAMFALCVGLFQRFALFQAGLTWYGLLYGYVVWEFAHYVYHYLAHKVRLLWCLHSTHHAPVAMNLTVNYAHIFLEGPYADTVRTTICILAGVSPPLLILIMVIDGFWGQFIHISDKLLRDGRLGVLGRFMLTPSHHRVHHARNVLYMDTNFCNLLNIWDRVFGTYQEERNDIVIEYGITRPMKPRNVIDAYLGEFYLLGRDVGRAPGMRSKFMYLVMPPGWSHDGQHKTAKACREALLQAGAGATGSTAMIVPLEPDAVTATSENAAVAN